MDKSNNLNLREFFNHPLWEKKRTYSETEAWLEMLFLAGDEADKKEHYHAADGKIKSIKLERGEFRLNLQELEKRWKWSRYKIKIFLDFLTNNKQIIITSISRKIHVIKISNYNKYCPLEKCSDNASKESCDDDFANSWTNNLLIQENCEKSDENSNLSTLYNKYKREYIEKDSQKSESSQTKPNSDFIKFNLWLRENAPFCADPIFYPKQFTEKEFLALKKRYTGTQISKVIEKLDNRTDLHGRYYNLPLTVKIWLKKEYKR